MSKILPILESVIASPVTWGVIALAGFAIALSGRLSMTAANWVMWIAFGLAVFGIYRAEVILKMEPLMRFMVLGGCALLLAAGTLAVGRWMNAPKKDDSELVIKPLPPVATFSPQPPLIPNNDSPISTGLFAPTPAAQPKTELDLSPGWRSAEEAFNLQSKASELAKSNTEIANKLAVNKAVYKYKKLFDYSIESLRSKLSDLALKVKDETISWDYTGIPENIVDGEKLDEVKFKKYSWGFITTLNASPAPLIASCPPSITICCGDLALTIRANGLTWGGLTPQENKERVFCELRDRSKPMDMQIVSSNGCFIDDYNKTIDDSIYSLIGGVLAKR